MIAVTTLGRDLSCLSRRPALRSAERTLVGCPMGGRIRLGRRAARSAASSVLLLRQPSLTEAGPVRIAKHLELPGPYERDQAACVQSDLLVIERITARFERPKDDVGHLVLPRLGAGEECRVDGAQPLGSKLLRKLGLFRARFFGQVVVVIEKQHRGETIAEVATHSPRMRAPKLA